MFLLEWYVFTQSTAKAVQLPTIYSNQSANGPLAYSQRQFSMLQQQVLPCGNVAQQQHQTASMRRLSHICCAASFSGKFPSPLTVDTKH